MTLQDHTKAWTRLRYGAGPSIWARMWSLLTWPLTWCADRSLLRDKRRLWASVLSAHKRLDDERAHSAALLRRFEDKCAELGRCKAALHQSERDRACQARRAHVAECERDEAIEANRELARTMVQTQRRRVQA